MKSRRYGKFKITLDIIQSNPEEIKKVMAHCIIYDARCDYLNHRVEYLAESELFEPVSVGQLIPEYLIVLNGDTVTAERL